MRIIKKGNYNASPWLGKWSCYRCKSVWEIDATDTQPEYHAATDQRDDSYYYMNCPVCGYQCNKSAKN